MKSIRGGILAISTPSARGVIGSSTSSDSAETNGSPWGSLGGNGSAGLMTCPARYRRDDWWTLAMLVFRPAPQASARPHLLSAVAGEYARPRIGRLNSRGSGSAL